MVETGSLKNLSLLGRPDGEHPPAEVDGDCLDVGTEPREETLIWTPASRCGCSDCASVVNPEDSLLRIPQISSEKGEASKLSMSTQCSPMGGMCASEFPDWIAALPL